MARKKDEADKKARMEHLRRLASGTIEIEIEESEESDSEPEKLDTESVVSECVGQVRR
jgi:hypothetical protein